MGHGRVRDTAAQWGLVFGAIALCAPVGCYDGGPRVDDAEALDDSDGGGGSDGSDGDGGDDPPRPTGNGFDEPDTLGAVGLRRLSHTELINSLHLALKVEPEVLAPLVALLPADSATPFDNDYRDQEPSQPLIEGMLKIAEELAVLVGDDPVHTAEVLGCTPSGPDDAACLRSGMARVGRVLLRRPLGDAELSSYEGFLAEAEEDGDFAIALRLALTAVLMDAEFLYRVESGVPVDGQDGWVRLTDIEMASRLSFLLWGSGPDDALLDLAEQGELATAAGIWETAQWMVEQPPAVTQLQRLHAMWLGYDNLAVEPTLAASMRTETDALIERALDEGHWLSIFTAPDSYLDDALAQHYGLPSPGAQPGWVDYPDIRRGGLLSHGSFLALGKKFNDTSPVERGKAVWERLLCNELPPPPPEVDAGVPPSGGPPDACKEERYDMRDKAECATCHAILDPIGFGLENYGPAGEWRTTDVGRPECSIAGQGSLQGLGDFAGPAQLGELLVDTGQLQGCVSQQLLQFAVGRALGPDDAPMAAAMAETFNTDDDFVALVLNLAASEGFRHRRLPEDP